MRIETADRAVGETDRALAHLRDAAALRPDRPLYLNALARALATHPEPGERDAPRAIALANRAAIAAPIPWAPPVMTTTLSAI